MYLDLNHFEVVVTAEQLRGVSAWLAMIAERYGRDNEDMIFFGSLQITLTNFSWVKLPMLLEVAKQAKNFPHQFGEDDFTVAKGRRQLQGVVDEARELGIQAWREDWHEDWLGVMFEEWLEGKVDSATARRDDLVER